MHADRWRRLRRVIESALEVPDTDRALFLHRECAGDGSLLVEARALLRLDDRSGRLLDPPAPGIGRAVALEAIAAGSLGRCYGAYRAAALVSAGGAGGAVYKGVPVDGAADRVVAIKVLRPEVHAAETARRFERERRVLSALDHPGICKLIDTGVADDGSPFIVMEYVDGPPIDDYCRSRPLRDRLELLRSVCTAVAYAHQRGVVHRDLKPPNILVGPDGRPKVIDFGVARLTAPAALEATLRTDPGRLIGTMPYMSPEQMAGDPARIDARADVYALGVLLFRLACGRLPFDMDGRPLPEAARLVTESEPRRLASLGRQFRGDLDTIAAKALEKNPARRYQSAAELDADLGRHLAREPIAARPPGLADRARRFARRHAALAVAAISVLVVLLASIIAVSAALVRSEREAARARSMNVFLQDLLVSVNPYRLPRGVRTLDKAAGVRVDDLLDDAAARLDSGWIRDGRTEADIRQSLGLTYAGLNRPADAERQFTRALDLRSSILGASAPPTLETRSALGSALSSLGRNQEAERLLTAAAEDLKQQLGPRDERTFSAVFERASFMVLQHRFGEAQADADRMLAAEAGRPESHRGALARAIKAIAVIGGGQFAEGRELGAAAMAALERTGCRNHYMAGVCAGALAMAAEFAGTTEEAERYYREAHASCQRLLGDDDARTAEFALSLGTMLLRRERFAEAHAVLTPAFASLERAYGPSHYLSRRASTDLAAALRGQGRVDDAATLLERSMEACSRNLGPDHAGTLQIAASLAALRCEQERFAEAEPLARRAHLGLQNSGEIVRDERLLVADTYAACLNGLGRYDEAQAVVAAALASWHEETLQDRAVRAILRMRLGQALLGLGRRDEAIDALQDSVQSLEAARGAAAGVTRRAQALLDRASGR